MEKMFTKTGLQRFSDDTRDIFQIASTNFVQARKIDRPPLQSGHQSSRSKDKYSRVRNKI